MTFEQFLETWNSDLSAKIIEFTGELGYTDHPEILAQTLEYGIAYADFFENADGHNTDLLIFLKAICVRVIFFSEDTEIENRSGRLWERAIASMSMPHQRLVQIPLEADAVEEILRPLKSLQLEKEQDTLHQELFNPHSFSFRGSAGDSRSQACHNRPQVCHGTGFDTGRSS